MVGYAQVIMPSLLSYVSNALLVCRNNDIVSSSRRRLRCAFVNPGKILQSTFALYSSSSDGCELPDNFSRYSKFLVKNSNGVDGLGGGTYDNAEHRRRKQYTGLIRLMTVNVLKNPIQTSSLNLFLYSAGIYWHSNFMNLDT